VPPAHVNQHSGRCAGDSGHSVVFGEPEASVSHCSACRARSRLLRNDWAASLRARWGKIENGIGLIRIMVGRDGSSNMIEDRSAAFGARRATFENEALN